MTTDIPTPAPRRAGSARPSVMVAGAFLAAAAVVLVVFPAGEAVRGIIAALSPPFAEASSPSSIPSLLRLLGATLGWALLIAVASTVLAWPAAWVMRGGRAGRGRRAWAAFVLVPLLLPSSLAYAGWSILRAPMGGGGLGDWLGHQPPWVNVAVTKAFALGGLCLWAWPLAAIILAAGVRRIPDEVLDALDLDMPPGRGSLLAKARRWGVVVSLVGPSLLTALAGVMLVMIGSAVPLHLAQFETFAIVIWRDLSLTTEPARVWVHAWPLMVIAVAAAAVLASRLNAAQRNDPIDSPPRGSRAGRAVVPTLATLAVWSLSVLAPLVLFATALRERPKPLSLATMRRMIVDFWRLSAGSVWNSLISAALVALCGLAIAGAMWAVLSIRPRPSRASQRLALLVLAILLIAGLAPGILVGSAVNAAWNGHDATRWVADSTLIVILGHLARFGFLAAIVGWWAAAMEPAMERDLRRIDGADTFAAWLTTRAGNPAGGLGAVVGIAIALGVLSFHEIEATVMLQPPAAPGSGSFALQVLDSLHFARDERLAAAAVSLLGFGIVIAFAAAYLLIPAEEAPAPARSAAGV